MISSYIGTAWRSVPLSRSKQEKKVSDVSAAAIESWDRSKISKNQVINEH